MLLMKKINFISWEYFIAYYWQCVIIGMIYMSSQHISLKCLNHSQIIHKANSVFLFCHGINIFFHSNIKKYLLQLVISNMSIEKPPLQPVKQHLWQNHLKRHYQTKLLCVIKWFLRHSKDFGLSNTASLCHTLDEVKIQ